MSYQQTGLAVDASSAIMAEVVTKSDTVNFTNGLCRALYVGGAGDVAIVFQDDSVVTFSSVPAGTQLMVRAKRINSTNTTATLMVAMF